MKRVAYAFFALIMLVSGINPIYADGPIDPQEISAKHVYAYEVKSGKEIFSKDPDKPCPEASTTKLMTALIIQEAINDGKIKETDIYTVKEDSAMFKLPDDSSMMGPLKAGEEMSVKDMMTGMLVVSGNDAATVLAENFLGKTTDFVDRMNERAQELGMTETKFWNVHGLDREGHVTTAKDFSRLATACYNTPGFLEMTKLDSYEIPATNKSGKRTCYSTNRLIRDRDDETSYRYEYANGMKTGNTGKAGYCVVASAEKDETGIIIVMFGDESDKGLKRWTDCKKIFEYSFNTYKGVDIKPIINEISIERPVSGSNIDEEKGLTGSARLSPEIEADDIIYYDLEEKTDRVSGGDEKFTPEITLSEDLTAPLKKGAQVGTVKYTLGDYETPEFNLIVEEDVPQAGMDTIETPDLSASGAEASAEPQGQGAASGNNDVLRATLIVIGIIIALAAISFGVMFILRHRDSLAKLRMFRTNKKEPPVKSFSTAPQSSIDRGWDFDFDDHYPPPDTELLSRSKRNQEPSETAAKAPAPDVPADESATAEPSIEVYKTAEQKIAEHMQASQPEHEPIKDDVSDGYADERAGISTHNDASTEEPPQRQYSVPAEPVESERDYSDVYAPPAYEQPKESIPQLRTLRGNGGYVRRRR